MKRSKVTDYAALTVYIVRCLLNIIECIWTRESGKNNLEKRILTS